MATLTEQVQGERMARVALSIIAEPNDAASGQVLARVGGAETLRLIESDDPVPGLARADALMWRERLAARITPAVLGRVAETQGGAFGTLIPSDKDWPAALNDLGDRAPYLLWTRGATSFLTRALVAVAAAMVRRRSAMPGCSCLLRLGPSFVIHSCFSVSAVSRRHRRGLDEVASLVQRLPHLGRPWAGGFGDEAGDQRGALRVRPDPAGRAVARATR
jgi:hypothetical protein